MLKITEKYGKSSVFFVGLLLLFAIIMTESILVDNARKFFVFEGIKFNYIDQDAGKYIFEDENGAILELEYTDTTVYRTNRYKDYKVTYKDDVYNIDFIEVLTKKVYQNEQLIYEGPSSTYIVSGHYKTDVPLYELVPMAIEKINEYIVIPIVLLTTLLGALGLVMIIYPKELWKINTFLSVRGGEPTDFYIISCFIGGVFLIVYSIIQPLLVIK